MAKRKLVLEIAYRTNEGNECVTQFNSFEEAVGWKCLTDYVSPGFIVEWNPRGFVAA